MRRAFQAVSCVLLAIGFVRGEQAFLSGPIQGLLFDMPTHSFRSVIGFPGSASIGPSLLDGIDYGSVAPHKDYGIALQGGQLELVSGLNSGQPSTSVIAGFTGQPEAVAWSGDGSLAILYSRTGNWIQMLTGLPDAPNLDAPIEVSQFGGALTSVAADSKGKSIAIGLAGDTGGVYLMTVGQGFIPALQLQNPVALAFSDDDAILYGLDAASLQFSELNTADFTSQAFMLDGLANPISIKPVLDAANRRILCVLSRSDQLLRMYDASSHQFIADIPLDFLPTGIDALGRSSFVVSSRAKQSDPLWLFTSAPQQAVYFVPALTLGGQR